MHGLLVVDKPPGLSSNQALQRVKYLLNARKAGHTGTLDPLATGVLVMCFGRGTKVAEHITGAKKSYRVVARLGEQTDTADSEGKIISSKAVTQQHRDNYAEVATQFIGRISQLPPMYSALKKDGVALYKMARAGKEVEREPRLVQIDDIELEYVQGNSAAMTVHCSKGTYIRTLVEDIGNQLGCGAHVVELRRLSVGEFGQHYPMISIDQLEQMLARGDSPERMLLPIECAFMAYPDIGLNEGLIQWVEKGFSLRVPENVADEAQFLRIYDTNQGFRGLAQVNSGRIANFTRFSYN